MIRCCQHGDVRKYTRVFGRMAKVRANGAISHHFVVLQTTLYFPGVEYCLLFESSYVCVIIRDLRHPILFERFADLSTDIGGKVFGYIDVEKLCGYRGVCRRYAYEHG